MDKLQNIIGLNTEYADCRKCPQLCVDRKLIMPGSGNLSASIMVIVDAPTQDDERSGALLEVGNVAELVQDAFSAADVRWSDVYVTSMVSCRPFTHEVSRRGAYTRNRNPTKSELDNCRERLLREIYIVDPKVLVLMGDAPAKLATPNKITSAAGELYYVKVPGKSNGIEIRYPAIPTWNPVLAEKDSVRTSRIAIEKHIKLAVNLSRAARTVFESRTKENV